MPNVGVSSFQYDSVHPFDDEAMVQTSHGVDIAVVLFERGYPEVGWPWDWQCNDHFKEHVRAFIDSIDTTSQHMDIITSMWFIFFLLGWPTALRHGTKHEIPRWNDLYSTVVTSPIVENHP